MTGTKHYANNFDFLRFISAAFIIISHCFALRLGYQYVSVDSPLLYLGYLGLFTLFVISGYLISMSWERTESNARYFWKRSLRLFPGFIASIIFVLFVIGPMVTSLSISDYFSALFSTEGILSVPFYNDGSVVGIFTTNPVTYVNAVLWTIPVEFIMYVLVALVGAAGLLRKDWVHLSMIAAIVLIWMMWFDDPSLSKVRFVLYFLIGAFLYQKRELIRFDWRIALVLIAILAIGIQWRATAPFVALFTIPYLVLYAAYLPKTEWLHNFGRHGDISYGMFIYSYPIIQAIIYFTGNSLSLVELTIASFVFTIPVAYLSWRFIESRALALKESGFFRKRSS